MEKNVKGYQNVYNTKIFVNLKEYSFIRSTLKTILPST